ncbi:MAG: putative zinc-binding protein [Armatimonadia bacterium]
MNQPAVAVLGCCGIGQLMSTIVRRAVHQVMEQRPEAASILSVGALIADVPEELEKAADRPLVVINGCREKCGTVIAEGKSLCPSATINALQVVGQSGISIYNQDREGLTENGLAVAEKLAEAIIAEIDRLSGSATPPTGATPATCAEPTPTLLEGSAGVARDHVCLQPCLGTTSAASMIGRQASYAARLQLGPKRADLGCAPALYADVPEDVIFVQQDHVIAIESCEKSCAARLVEMKGCAAHATVRVDEVLAREGFDVKDLPADHLPLEHPAVQAVAAEIVRVAEGLLGEGTAKTENGKQKTVGGEAAT